MDLEVRHLDIEPQEIVAYLLQETGQLSHDSLNTDDLLSYLKLKLMQFDFSKELPNDLKKSPRALLSFPHRLIATDSNLMQVRKRFSVLHEIGHYILPSHQRALYLCDEKAMSQGSRVVFECEANTLAADLIFMGDRFTLEANSSPINVKTVESLGKKYDASFEATARRMVEKSFRECMLIVFRESSGITAVETIETKAYEVRYCVASSPFKSRFGFSRVSGTLSDNKIITKLMSSGGISDSFVTDTTITDTGKFHSEYFTNTYNIFAFLTPAE